MVKKHNVPKSIVILLIFLAVFISIAGTWTVLSEISKMDAARPTQDFASQGANVSVTIIDPLDINTSIETKGDNGVENNE